MAGINAPSLTAEFIGTFILIFTVGCNVLSSNPVWGGVSIACSLMVGIYALGGVSGANFNPAVSTALGLAGKMEQGWAQVGAYCAVQVVSGIVAAFSYTALFGASFNLGPTKGYGWWQAMLCEMLYTFMLCFVVLNTAASKKIGGKNQFYGLAIGFVIVAGAYGPGAVSGGCFNPAVAIAIDVSSMSKGFGWCLVYTAFEIIGAGLAVGMFKAMRPEENDDSEAPSDYGMNSKLISEGIGTFMLVLTAGLNVLVHSKAAAFSIAASLMCMIYACGDVSGAHFNPAVTVAILLSGREKIDGGSAGKYMGVQIVAGLAGALTYALIMGGVTFPIGPGKGFGWMGVATAEIAFTFVLTYVVLCVATVKNNPAPEMTGFIIGSCVTVGGLAIGIISGGSLNPAVSFGIGVARIFFGGNLWRCFVYMLLEFIGGAAAATVFKITHPEEYENEAEKAEKVPLQA
jgi:aquaporin Z